jgi:hypothetical protein
MPRCETESQPVVRQGNWVFNPNSSGKPIPELVQRRTDARLRRDAEKHYAGRYSRLEIRFRSQVLLCRRVDGTCVARSKLAASQLAGDTRGVHGAFA